jgi:uncharacterized protein (TIGR02391 family)
MARRPPQPAPAKRPADISSAEVPGAIAKLQRRLREFEGAKPKYNGDQYHIAESLCSKLDGTLVEIFGADTLEYERVHTARVEFSLNMMVVLDEVPQHLYVEAFESGRAAAISRIKTMIDVLSERVEDSGNTGPGRALRAYEGLELHPAIANAASDLYRDGHYANAIEDAVKALNNLVRLKSALELDGSPLMQKAFGGDDPLLRFNDLADESDQNEQKGFMMMFSGAVAGLRNPRAHKLIKDDPERALEFIAFVSLLAKLLDGAKKRRPARGAP